MESLDSLLNSRWAKLDPSLTSRERRKGGEDAFSSDAVQRRIESARKLEEIKSRVRGVVEKYDTLSKGLVIFDEDGEEITASSNDLAKGRVRVLILDYERLCEDRAAVLDSLYDWLQLPRRVVDEQLERAADEGYNLDENFDNIKQVESIIESTNAARDRLGSIHKEIVNVASDYIKKAYQAALARADVEEQERLKEKLENAEAEIAGLADNLANAMGELGESKAQIRELSDSLARREDEVRRVRERSDQQIVQLKEQLSVTSNELSICEVKLRRTTEELNHVRKESEGVQGAQAQASALQTRLAEVENENLKARQLLEDTKAQAVADQAELREQITILVTQYQQAISAAAFGDSAIPAVAKTPIQMLSAAVSPILASGGFQMPALSSMVPGANAAAGTRPPTAPAGLRLPLPTTPAGAPPPGAPTDVPPPSAAAGARPPTAPASTWRRAPSAPPGSLSAAVVELKSQKENTLIRMEELEKEISGLLNKEEQLRAELKELGERVGILSRDVKGLKSTEHDAGEERARLNAAIESKQAALEAVETTKTELSLQRQELQASRANIEQQLLVHAASPCFQGALTASPTWHEPVETADVGVLTDAELYKMSYMELEERNKKLSEQIREFGQAPFEPAFPDDARVLALETEIEELKQQLREFTDMSSGSRLLKQRLRESEERTRELALRLEEEFRARAEHATRLRGEAQEGSLRDRAEVAAYREEVERLRKSNRTVLAQISALRSELGSTVKTLLGRTSKVMTHMLCMVDDFVRRTKSEPGSMLVARTKKLVQELAAVSSKTGGERDGPGLGALIEEISKSTERGGSLNVALVAESVVAGDFGSLARGSADASLRALISLQDMLGRSAVPQLAARRADEAERVRDRINADLEEALALVSELRRSLPETAKTEEADIVIQRDAKMKQEIEALELRRLEAKMKLDEADARFQKDPQVGSFLKRMQLFHARAIDRFDGKRQKIVEARQENLEAAMGALKYIVPCLPARDFWKAPRWRQTISLAATKRHQRRVAAIELVAEGGEAPDSPPPAGKRPHGLDDVIEGTALFSGEGVDQDCSWDYEQPFTLPTYREFVVSTRARENGNDVPERPHASPDSQGKEMIESPELRLSEIEDNLDPKNVLDASAEGGALGPSSVGFGTAENERNDMAVKVKVPRLLRARNLTIPLPRNVLNSQQISESGGRPKSADGAENLDVEYQRQTLSARTHKLYAGGQFSFINSPGGLAAVRDMLEQGKGLGVQRLTFAQPGSKEEVAATIDRALQATSERKRPQTGPGRPGQLQAVSLDGSPVKLPQLKPRRATTWAVRRSDLLAAPEMQLSVDRVGGVVVSLGRKAGEEIRMPTPELREEGQEETPTQQEGEQAQVIPPSAVEGEASAISLQVHAGPVNVESGAKELKRLFARAEAVERTLAYQRMQRAQSAPKRHYRPKRPTADPQLVVRGAAPISPPKQVQREIQTAQGSRRPRQGVTMARIQGAASPSGVDGAKLAPTI